MHVASPCRVVNGVAAEKVPEGAEKVVAKEREARPIRQNKHSGTENRYVTFVKYNII